MGKMLKTAKRVLTGVLSAAMILTAVPVNTFAADDTAAAATLPAAIDAEGYNDDIAGSQDEVVEVTGSAEEKTGEDGSGTDEMTPAAGEEVIGAEIIGEEGNGGEVIGEEAGEENVGEEVPGEEVIDEEAIGEEIPEEEALPAEEDSLEAEEGSEEDSLLAAGDASTTEVIVSSAPETDEKWYSVDWDSATNVVFDDNNTPDDPDDDQYWVKVASVDGDENDVNYNSITLKITPAAGNEYRTYEVTDVSAVLTPTEGSGIELTTTNSGPLYTITKPDNSPLVGSNVVITVTVTKTDISSPPYKVVFDKEPGSGFGKTYEVTVNNGSKSEKLNDPSFTFDSPGDIKNTKFTIKGISPYNAFAVNCNEAWHSFAYDGSLKLNITSDFDEDNVANIKVFKNVRFNATIDNTATFKLSYTSGTKDTEMGRLVSYNKGPVDLKVTVTKVSTKTDLNGYSYTAELYQNGTLVDEFPVTNGVVTIGKAYVESAIYAEEDLELEIATAPKKVTVTADPSNKAKLFLCDPTADTFAGFKGGLIDDATGIEKNYAEEFFVYPEPDNYYSVRSMTLKGENSSVNTTLSKKTVTYEGKKYTYYSVPASLMKKDTKFSLCVVHDYVQEDDAVSFTVCPLDCTVTVQKASYDNKKDIWTLPKKTKNFTYTVETKGNYTITGDDINLYSWQEVTEDVWEYRLVDGFQCSISGPVLNKTKDGFVYTVTGIAKQFVPYYEDHPDQLYVIANSHSRTLKINNANLNNISVKVNGRRIERDSSSGGFDIYSLAGYDPFDLYTISAEPEDGFRLKTSGIVNGNKVSVKNSSITTTAAFCGDDGVVEVEFDKESVAGLFDYFHENRYVENNHVYSGIKSNGMFTLMLGDKPLPIDSITPTPDSAVDAGYITVTGSDHNMFSVKCTKVKDASKPIKLAIKSKPVNGKTYSYNITINYAAELTDVKVKGADSNNVIKQDAGTQVEYPITLNSNADVTDFSAKVMTTSEEQNADAKLNAEKNALIVETYKSGLVSTSISTDDILVGFYKGEEKIGTVTIKPQTPKLTAPGISVSKVSDVGMVVSAIPPKGVDAYQNLYYMIEANADGAVASGMKESYGPVYIPVMDPGEGKAIDKFKELELSYHTSGNGAEQKYKISATIVQAKEATADYSGGELFAKSSTKTIKEKTRKPSYEVKMGFAKKTTSFVRGETTFASDGSYRRGWVCVGMARFSNSTSFTEVDTTKTCITYMDGGTKYKLSFDDGWALGADGLSIWVDTTKFIIPSCQATLHLYADLGAYTEYTSPVYTEVPLTVKGEIKYIQIQPYTYIMYKQDGKPATMQFTAVLEDPYRNEPGYKKIRWEITPDSPMYGYVDIDDNGKVTIDKDYVLDPERVENTFKIRAVADDIISDNPYKNETGISVENSPISVGVKVTAPDGTTVISEEELKKGVDSDLLSGAKMEFNDSNTGRPISLANLSVTFPGKDFRAETVPLLPGNAYKIWAERTGTYTVTATAADGGKSTKKITIKNNGLQIKEGDFSKDTSAEKPASYYIGGKFTFYKDEEGTEPIDPSRLSFKCSSGLVVDGEGNITSITKKGTLKVTATPTDGSKSSKSVEIKVSGLEIGTATLGGAEIVDNGEYTYDSNTLYGKEFVFKDQAGETISYDQLKITTSPTGLTIGENEEGKKCVTGIKKEGTYKVTVKTMDGSDSKSYKIKVTPSGVAAYSIFKLSNGENDIDPDEPGGKVYTTSNANIIIALVERDDSTFKFDAELKVKGGKILKTEKFYESEVSPSAIFAIIPDADADTINLTLNYGKQKDEYVVKNTIGSTVPLTLSSNSKAEMISTKGEYAKTRFSFYASTYLDPTPGKFFLKFQPGEDYWKCTKESEENAYKQLVDNLNGVNSVGVNQVDVSGTVVTNQSYAYGKGVAPGKYKIDVTLWEKDGESLVQKTQRATVTFTVKAPGKLSAKLDTKTVEIDERIHQVRTDVYFASSSTFVRMVPDEETGEVKVTVLNNNDKGQINDFAQWFNASYVVDDSGKKKIVLERTGDIDDKWFKGNVATLVGWLQYTVEGEDGESVVTYTEKVTVRLIKE